jgi:uracil-DNA glycosylase
MSRRYDRFIAALAGTKVSDRACNQYSTIDGDLRGNAIRRGNLKRYLEEIEAIGSDTLLVGEAPSYRGGRLTGIPFVSERVMLDGTLGPGYRKATPGDTLSTEASATMVWATIRDIDPLPMLWNAFPFHPFERGNPHTNRMPDATELEIGQRFLSALIRLFAFRHVVAIGNHAAKSLTRMNIAHEKVRHPSQGGKRKFVAGIARVSQMRQAASATSNQQLSTDVGHLHLLQSRRRF